MTPAEIAARAVERHGALQKVEELAELVAFLELHFADAPRAPRVVEIGADAGGTLYVWRALWGALAEVLTVTLPQGAPGSTGRPLDPHGAHVIIGDSHSPAVEHEVRVWAGAGVGLVFVDGDHSYLGAMRDVMTYSRMLRPGGVLVLHDIVNGDGAEGIDGPAVWADWTRHLPPGWVCHEIVAANPSWGGLGVAVSPRGAPTV